MISNFGSTVFNNQTNFIAILLLELLVLTLVVGSMALIVVGVLFLSQTKNRDKTRRGGILLSVGVGLLAVYVLARVVGLL